MKKYVVFNENKIEIVPTSKQYLIEEVKEVNVLTRKVAKNEFATVLNATANALSSSIANGNELTIVYVQLKIGDKQEELIAMNDDPLVRNSLDYHEKVREARKLQEKIKNAIK